MMNPATREFKCLPPTPPPVSYPTYVDTDTYDFALGFDSKSNDYKVVRIVRLDDTLRQRELPPMFQIYTLSSNSWREIDVAVPIHICFGVASSAYINGINHWIAFEPQGWVIVSFDFGDEVLRTKRGPDVDCCGFLRHAFTVLNGSLALILFKDGQREPSMEIWVTNNDDSWTCHSTIGPVKDCRVPLAIWGNIKVFFSKRKGEWCLYEHSTREIRIIKSYSGRRCLKVVIYDKSLVSIQAVNWYQEEDTTVSLDCLSNVFAHEK